MQLTPYQRDILIRTVAGEAGAESADGQAAVVHTILNRAADGRWPSDPAKVALQPKQFSTWNKGVGGNALPYTTKPGSAAYEAIGQIVDGVASGAIADPTGGAVYYYAPKGMAGGKKPSWYGSANREGAARRLGNHIFLGRVGGATKAGNLVRGMGSPRKPDPKVKALQEQLIAAGYDLGKAGADGVFGKRTEQAVYAYNAKYGLSGGTAATADTLKSLAATASPAISPQGLYPPPQSEPPPVWPDSFNPPTGLNIGNAFPETSAPFPGLPSPAPASAPIGRMDAPVPTVGPMGFDPAQMVPDTRAKAPPGTMPEMISAQGANIRGDFVQPGQVPDIVAQSPPDATAAMAPEIAPKMLPEFSAFPARPEYPGALPAAAPPAPFVSSDREWDPISSGIAAFERRKADFNRAIEENAGKPPGPNFDFATAPTPLGQDAVRPPPWSDRALMMGPPVREDITTANSPFAAGINALSAPPKPYTPDFEFTAGSGGDPSLAQWLERNGPNAPKATAQGGPLDFLSGILPEQNLLRDLGLMGAGEASAAIPPTSRALPPLAAPAMPTPPAATPAAPQSGVWDPFGTQDPNKDQSRHPAMGPLSLGVPMGGTRIPPTMVADASGALPDISVNDFAARFGPGAPPPATFPGRPGVPGALPAAPSPAPPRPIPGVATFPGPAVGIPAEPVVAPPPVGDPMAITPPFASGPTPPAPLPTPQPVKPPERKGLFGGPVGKAVLGLLGGIPGAALGIGTGGKFGTNFAGILGGGPPTSNLFQSAGTSVSPNGMATTFGTWGNTGQRAVQGPGGQTYVQQSDGTWAQAL